MTQNATASVPWRRSTVTVIFHVRAASECIMGHRFRLRSSSGGIFFSRTSALALQPFPLKSFFHSFQRRFLFLERKRKTNVASGKGEEHDVADVAVRRMGAFGSSA